MSTDLQRAGGQIQTVGFSDVEAKPYAETSATALAAREQAIVQARIITAIQRPRNIERFRTQLLAECKRPGFAEAAEYSRPVGKEKDKATGQWVEKFATGPTIRLIETAIQKYGNIIMESQIIFETDDSRIVRCMAWDLETNAIWDKQVALPKRVEKRGFKGRDGKVDPPRGRTVVGQRINSEGDVTFLVLATDDEMRIVQSALESKTQRKNAERLLPGDIISEALDECRKTIAAGIEADPKAAIRRIIDGFSQFNVQVTDLEVWLGKTIEKINPREIGQLRSLWQGLKDGEVTWDEALLAKDPVGSAEASAKVAEEKIKKLQFKENPTPTEGKWVEGGGSTGTGPKQSEAAEGAPVASGQATGPAHAARPAAKYVSQAQITAISDALATSDVTADEFNDGLKASFGAASIEMIPAEKFESIMGTLRTLADDPAPMTEAEMQQQTVAADKPVFGMPPTKRGRPKF